MPRIPKYANTQPTQTSQTIDVTAPARIGAQVGQAFSDIGRATAAVAENERLIDEKLKRNKEKQQLAEAETELMAGAQNIMFEAEKQFKDDPDGALNFVEQKQQELSANLLNKIEGEQARNIFNNQMRQDFVRQKGNVRSWQIRQTIENTQAKNEQIATQSSTAAYEAAQQGLGLGALNNQLSNITLAAEASNEVFSEAERSEYKTTAQKQGVLSYATGLIDANEITRTRELLKSKEHREMLQADGISKVNRMLKAKIAQNEALAAKRAKLKKTNPWLGVGAEAGIIDFNYTTDKQGQRLKSQLQARNSYLQGLDPLQKQQMGFLRPEEARQFEAFVDRLPIDQSGEFLKWFDANAPSDDQTAIGEAIYRGTENAAMAVGITIASEAPKDAELMVRGKRFFDLEQSGKGKTPRTGSSTFLSPSSRQVKEAFEAYYPPDTIVNPEQRLMAREAAYYHYVGKTAASGTPFSPDLDTDEFRKSLETVVGPTLTVSGQDIVSFRGPDGKYLTEHQIEQGISNITKDDLIRIQGSVPITTSGKEVDIGKNFNTLSTEMPGLNLLIGGFLGQYQLRNTHGTGVFNVTDKAGNYLLDKTTGRPYELKLGDIFNDEQWQKEKSERIRRHRTRLIMGGK